MGAISNLFLPPLIGAYARRNTVQRAMHIPMVTAIALSVACLVLALVAR
jgi:hypothetical protein